MENPWLILVGLVATFLGFSNLENARRGLIFRPMTIFWSLVAGYFCYRNFLDLYHAGDLYVLAGFGLLFAAVSPILGWLWWGHDGQIRKRLFRTFLFLVLTAVGFVVWPLFPGVEAGTIVAGLSLLTASLPFLGMRKRLRLARWQARSRRDRRRERQEARRQELRVQQQDQAVVRDQNRTAQLERDLESRDLRIAKLKSGEKKRIADLARQRKEIAEQIRLLREEEVGRIRQGSGSLRFHPHHGFLMAEAWRVLRAQIARGDRIPAAEHDAFFFQVVEELLGPNDFEDRYFHTKGRAAIGAVNRYLGGRDALSTVRSAVAQLQLDPDLLAPEPLPAYDGHALLEAWLVPHRRFQHRLWEDFQGGLHPQQEAVIRYLRNQNLGLPSPEEWRKLWDENPRIFAASIDPGSTPTPIAIDGAQRLWRRVVSSIWNNAKVR